MKMARPLLAVGLLSMAAVALSGWQRFGGAPSPGLQPSYDQSDLSIPSEFFFSRLRYNTGYGGGGNRRFGAGWAQDFPRADHDCLPRPLRHETGGTRSSGPRSGVPSFAPVGREGNVVKILLFLLPKHSPPHRPARRFLSPHETVANGSSETP